MDPVAARDEVDGVMIEMDAESTQMPVSRCNTISSIEPSNKCVQHAPSHQKYNPDLQTSLGKNQFNISEEAAAASVPDNSSHYSSHSLKGKEIDPLIYAAEPPSQLCHCEASGCSPPSRHHKAHFKTRERKPKSSVASSSAKRTVQWADNVNVIIDNAEYEQYRNFLLTLRITNKPATVEAVKFMLSSDCSIDSNGLETLITLATNMLRIKLNYLPNSRELFSTLIDADLQEKPIVAEFAQYCQTQSGKAIIHSLLNTSASDQYCSQSRHSLHQQQLQQQTIECSSNSDKATNNPYQEKLLANIPSSDIIPTSHHNNTSSTLFDSQSVTPFKDSELQQATEKARYHSRDSVRQTFSKDVAISALKQEHESLKKMFTCVSCQVRPTEILFLPCGHVSLCGMCSDKCTVCPVCNKNALGEIRIFWG